MPTTAADIAIAFDKANENLATLNNLLSSDRFTSNTEFYAIRVYLEQLIPYLKDIFHTKAVEEINSVIGDNNAQFNVFQGLDTDDNKLSFESLRVIYDKVVGTGAGQGCDKIDLIDELNCLVEAADLHPEIKLAVKHRIILEVDKKVGFQYSGQDGGIAFPVFVDGQATPWDNDAVSASLLYEGVPFVYDRQAAAQKAVAIAGQSDRGHQSNGNVDGIQFVTGLGLTDSARFISLCLRAGGIPMTTTGQVGQCDPNVAVGWCASEVPNNRFQGNPVWRNHNANNSDPRNDAFTDLTVDTRLAAYLLGNPDVVGSDIALYYLINDEYVDADATDNFEELLISEVVGLTTEGAEYAPDAIITSPILENGKYQEIGNNLATIQSRISNFAEGDYIVILGPSPHGFMITEINIAKKCSSSDTIAGINIPYVADLPGVQNGDSRPFYCTRIQEDFNDNASFFQYKRWYFIKVPDLWLVKFTRLFHDPLSDTV